MGATHEAFADVLDVLGNNIKRGHDMYEQDTKSDAEKNPLISAHVSTGLTVLTIISTAIARTAIQVREMGKSS